MTANIVAHSSYVLDLQFTPQGDALLSAGMEGQVKAWQPGTWQELWSLAAHAQSVNSLAISPDGRLMATGSTDQTVRLWDLAGRTCLQTWQNRKRTVSRVIFSSDGRWVLSANYGGRVAAWDVSGESAWAFAASKANLSALALNRAGTLLAVGGLGSEIGLWSVPEGQALGMLAGHRTAIVSLHFLEDGRRLISLGHGGGIRLWSADTHEMLTSASVGSEAPRGLVIAPGEQSAAVLLEGRVQLWGLFPLRLAAVLPVPGHVLPCAAFSPDERWLAVGGADGHIHVFPLEGQAR